MKSGAGYNPSAAAGGLGYAHVARHDEDDVNEKHYGFGAGGEERDVGTYNKSHTSGYEGRMEPGQAAGSAFPLSTGEGQSRTMRMAYDDPCEFNY
jgi:hypothetical protein